MYFQRRLFEWKEKDMFFAELHSFSAILKIVRSQPFVTFVGSPGSGKSATAYHIAFALMAEGYEVFKINNIRDIAYCSDSKQKQVFVLDDVLGVLGLEVNALIELSKEKDNLQYPAMKQSKVLMTCREVVFNQIKRHKQSDFFLLKSDNVIRLHSDKNALTYKDKIMLLKKYGIETEYIDLLSEERLNKTSKMFPLLCFFFSSEKKFKSYGVTFFETPYHCINDELDKMKTEEKLQYVSLVLLAICKNNLSEKSLKNKENFGLKSDLLEKCKVDTNTDNFKIIDALSDMTGTYTKNCNDEFSFFHDFMFEIVAYHFGSLFPEVILDNMNSVYIANYVRPETCDVLENETDGNRDNAYQENKFDLQIKIKQTLYPKLAKRVYEDIKNMQLFDVFMNNFLKHPQLCAEIINVMRRKSYTEILSLFLSEQADISKLVTQKERLKKDGEKRIKEHNIENLLMYGRDMGRTVERIIYQENGFSYIYSVRVISWVIYFGHHDILRYILDQMLMYKDDESYLFQIKNQTPFETKSSVEVSEKFRLFLLACLSSDVETFNILLDYVGNDQINKFSSCLHIARCPNYTPLAAACQTGNIDVVRKLLEHRANVNLHADDFDTPLVAACREGHIDIVCLLLNSDADLDLQGARHTPLTAACEGKHFDVIENLLIKGANVNKHNGMFQSPLTIACRSEHIEMGLIDNLLKKGANVNPEVADYTPLVYASRNGNIDLVKKLIKEGADVNLNNTKEPPKSFRFREEDEINARGLAGIRDKLLLPITYACIGGHLNVVKELINHNSEIDSFDHFLKLVCESGDIAYLQELDCDLDLICTGEFPLLVACKKERSRIILELLKAGEKIDLRDSSNILLTIACKFGYIDVVKKILNAKIHELSHTENACILKKVFTGYQDVFAQVLAEASLAGNVKIVQVLTNIGANINWFKFTTVNFITFVSLPSPLVAACEGRHTQIVDFLLQKGAKVNLQCGDHTPLTTACKMGNDEIVKMLIDNGAKINLQDCTDTPLTAASKEGHNNVVKYLIEKNANVNLKGLFDTPLTAACKYGHALVVNELLKAGALVNVHGYLNTPLTAACYCGDVEIVKMLIKKDADVNALGKFDSSLRMTGMASLIKFFLFASPVENYTPLTASTRRGHYEVVKVLLNANANVNLNDGFETPLSAACRHGHVRIAEKLLEKDADVNLINCWGLTPLYEAIFCMNEDRLKILKKLIEHGVDYSIKVRDLPPVKIFAKVKYGLDIEDLIL